MAAVTSFVCVCVCVFVCVCVGGWVCKCKSGSRSLPDVSIIIITRETPIAQ